VAAGVETYSGSFGSGGIPSAGRAHVVYEHDGTSLTGSVAKGGIFHGRATLTEPKTQTTLWIGSYLNGYAHGPGWAFPPGQAGRDSEDVSAVFAWFNRGRIDTSKDIASISFQTNEFVTGKIVNGSYMQNPR